MSASFRFVAASLALLGASLALGSRDANAFCLPILYVRSVRGTVPMSREGDGWDVPGKQAFPQ